MRLLLINFEMDPESKVLAWQHSVALELAKLCEHLVVLTNRATEFLRPLNMTVYVFPRILLRAPLRWAGGMNIFVWQICRRHDIDASFIHMNAIWGYRLAPVFHFLRIPVLLWYAHGTVTHRLKLAHLFVDRVVTSTPDGFRLPSKKLAVIGQGVDTSLFTIQELAPDAADILTVGRVSPRKRIDLMVEVMDALREIELSIPFRLVVIGAPLTSQDQMYQKTLEQKAAHSKASQNIQFVGHVPIVHIPAHYRKAFLHLNLSITGSMDKTVMEALAAGCPVLTSNEAFRSSLSGFPEFLVNDDHPKAIAHRILELYRRRTTIDRNALRGIVVGKHDLATYGTRILEELQKLKDAQGIGKSC